MNVLIVAAHPDDEVLGAGGAIAHHVSKKDKVSVAILGEGITSRYAKRTKAPASELKKLKACSKKALKRLGVNQSFYFDYPDNRFDSVDFLDIVKSVETVKKTVKPALIYTHSASDLNIDHQIAFKAVMTATRPVPGETVKKILSFEVPSSTEWNFSKHNRNFQPNVFLDISKFLSKKIKALTDYTSETMNSLHPRSPRGLTSLAEWRGVQVGKKAAEAFELIRDVS